MKRNRAFTIAEILFVLVFIGVISIIALHTANERFTDYFTRYFTAYDALSKASYNTYIDTYCRNENASEDGLSDCAPEKNNGIDYTQTGRPFPKTPYELKKRLSEYLNITEESKNDENQKEVISTAAESEFNNNTLQLVLTNGFRLYFSDNNDIEVLHAGKTSKTINYFIVYIDLNGNSKPNRADKHPDFATNSGVKPSKSTPRPDIIPFIVTSTGDVIPAGFPIYDRTYATARLLDADGNQTKSYTIDEARQLAYGNDKFYVDMPLTLIPEFDKVLPSSIKPGLKERKRYNIGDEDTKQMQCEAGTFNCIVKIDENEGKRF